MKEKLPFGALYIGNPVVRSEIGGSGSEKKLCTLLGPKPQNDPINISHAAKRPPDARTRTPEKIKKIDGFLPFLGLLYRKSYGLDHFT